MSNFTERLRTLRLGLWVAPISRTRFIKCTLLNGCKRLSHFPLFSHPRKNCQPETSYSRLFGICPVPATLLIGFSWAKFFCQDVTDHCALAGSTEYTLHPHCSVANMALDPSASAGRVLTNVAFGLAVQTVIGVFGG